MELVERLPNELQEIIREYMFPKPYTIYTERYVYGDWREAFYSYTFKEKIGYIYKRQWYIQSNKYKCIATLECLIMSKIGKKTRNLLCKTFFNKSWCNLKYYELKMFKQYITT